MQLRIIWLFTLTIFALACPFAMADGIDLVSYFTRTSDRHDSAIGVVGVIVLLMLANYAINFVVIGFPAIKISKNTSRLVIIDLIWLTLLGQVADRLGALIAAMMLDPIMAILGLSGEGSWVGSLILLNFLFSGIAVGVLSLYFLRRRWRVGTGTSWVIASVAAIVTNPAWAMLAWSM